VEIKSWRSGRYRVRFKAALRQVRRQRDTLLAQNALLWLPEAKIRWRSPAGERVRSFAIITTEPNELCAALHNRMPAILTPEAWPQWLGEEPAGEARLKSLLAPYPSDAMICWPVSARVGNVRNNDSSLIEPVAVA
jgi:putative SOS response-associated peptidase YedK